MIASESHQVLKRPQFSVESHPHGLADAVEEAEEDSSGIGRRDSDLEFAINSVPPIAV